jgi:hypothetical protein
MKEDEAISHHTIKCQKDSRKRRKLTLEPAHGNNNSTMPSSKDFEQNE